MLYIRQFIIIIFISFLAEVLRWLIPLPIPASIYGLLIMFFALAIGKIKVENVEKVAIFLIEIMPLMFIPAGVGLVEEWEKMSRLLIPIIVIIPISTIVVMIVAGRTTDYIIRRNKDGNTRR